MSEVSESERIIEVSNLTQDYGHGRGVFDVSLTVTKGQCYGFLGPNGAGKSTTIRHLMGFSEAQKGELHILGMDCWKQAAEIKTKVGYLPGEIAFPKGMTGTGFLAMMMRLRGVDDDSYLKSLLERFELDPRMDIDDMSLGVRRKLAVVTAFMHDPDILILDEPTSGLDPVMQQTFIDYITSEKERGKTILLSSHIFHEVDATCDRIAIIKAGRIIADFDSKDFKRNGVRIYFVTFADKESYDSFLGMGFRISEQEDDRFRARVMTEDKGVKDFLRAIKPLNICDMKEIPFTLEDYFMQFYKDERKGEDQ